MDEGQASPNVLIFPFLVQGHVNSMLKLAELLSLAGLHITFLNSEYNQQRLLCHTDIQARFIRFPGFRFQTISDGLPMENSLTGEKLMDMFDGLKARTRILFREMMISRDQLGCDTWPPISCIMADGIMSTFSIDIANEVGIPIILFRTISSCSFWAYFSVFNLIESGELPFADSDLDQKVTSIPSMEGYLRKRDLPSFMRVSNIDDEDLQHVTKETRRTPRAHALILNTFEDLEGPVLAQMRNHCPKTYAITRLASEATSQSSNSFRQDDRSCITWLDRQPPKSVIYVSFGSLAVVTRKELMEFGFDLVNSGSRFLWVLQSYSLAQKDADGKGPTPAELLEGAKERGYVVEWPPQEEVLAHPAVAGFLTHSRWNSTLESIFAGVPMICWPYFADQQINSRFVSHVWELGLDLKDTCDRTIVEKMVREVMVERKDEFMKTAEMMAERARTCVSEGGSSYRDLNSLIEEIKTVERLMMKGIERYVGFVEVVEQVFF